MGHSLGGATLEHLIGLEPDVGALVALEPYYDDSDFKTANLDAFEGALLSIGGELDLVVPPALNAYPMAQAASSRGRSTFAEIQDSSHYGATDFPYPGALDPMPWAEQHRIHRKLVTAFLRAELSGEEDALVALLGQAVAHEPIHVESLSFDPPLWVRRSQAPQDDHVLGIAARVGEPAWIAVSPHPASIATRAGVIGLEPATMQVVFAGPLQADGIAEVGFTPPAFLVGTTLHVQGLVLHPTGPILARTASWVVQ
jgi:hypothetical protein